MTACPRPRGSGRVALLAAAVVSLACALLCARPALAQTPAPLAPTATTVPAAPTVAATPLRPAATAAAPLPEPVSVRAEREIARLTCADTRERVAASRALVALGAAALPTIRAELATPTALAARLRAAEIELDPRSEPRREAPWYEGKLRDALQRLDRGEALIAWRMLDAILLLEPECPVRDRVEALRERARADFIRTTIVSARLVPKRVLVAPGEPIEVAIEVKNMADSPVDIAFDAEGGALALVEAELFVATPAGDRSRRREARTVPLRMSGRLAPGEVWTRSFRLPELPAAPRETFRRVTLSGSLRPSALTRGDESFNGALPLFPVELIVASPAYLDVAADPPAALRDALRALHASGDIDRAPLEERLFMAAVMAPSTERDSIIETLAPLARKADDPASNAAVRALATIADEPADRESVVRWLERR